MKINFANGVLKTNSIEYQYRIQCAKNPMPQATAPIKEEIQEAKNTAKNKALETAACLLGLVAISTVAITKVKKKSPLELFDIDYKKQLLKFMGVSEENIEKLKPIAGKEEFLNFLTKNQDDDTIFSVGENFLNVKKRDFGANFHIHTTNSDGRMSVQDLLDLSSSYADKYFEKHKKPFFIAITDHNTIDGNKEALDIIFKNPEKYKNLRVVLGSEINAMAGDDELHTLIYGINPYNGAIADKLSKMLQEQKEAVNGVIKKANNIYQGITKKYNFEFSFDDMAKIRPSIKHSPCSINYSMKDYMQFRSIYADVVENNSKLTHFLQKNKINLDEIDFSIPRKTITQNSPKMPYYRNYEDELYKYIEKIYKDKTGSEDLAELRKCYKEISPDIKTVLDELEYKTISKNEPLHCKTVKYDTLENILDLYSRESDCVCGMAHPCLTYKFGKPSADTKEGREHLTGIFELFDNKIKTPKISESYYKAYYKTAVTDDWRHFAKNLATKYNFLHSGSYDSHNKTPFTNNEFLSPELIRKLLEE